MLFDLIIQIHDMQDIKKLTLILVETFYLYVKDRTGIYVDSVMLFDIFRKADFIFIFDLHELASCGVVIYIRFQFRDLGQIRDPAVSDLVCDPVCEQRVPVGKETSLCDAVCLVVELLRHHFIEIPQFLMFQDLRMEFRDAVYGEARDDRHICHAHLTVHEDRHFPHFIFVARVHLADFDEESAVDLLYDLVDTRKQSGEQIDGPFFKSLCHDRMVCIRAGLCRYIPCLIPVQPFLIDQQTHQLRNRNCRMCIIHLDNDFLVKPADIAVFLLIFRDQRLKTCRDEEILLFQSEFFPGIVVVVRIENINDQLRKIFLFYRFVIVASVKFIKLKVCDRFRVPYTQCVYHMVAVSYDRHIIRDRKYRFIVLLDEDILARSRIFLKTDITAETDFFRVLFSAQFKRIALS